MYNIVGFQTNLKWGEQKRVFSMIPGLGNAEFVRYGVMHRNTFLDAPRVLSAGLCLQGAPQRLLCRADHRFRGLYGERGLRPAGGPQPPMPGWKAKKLPAPPADTMCGALVQYLTTENKHFQRPWARIWASFLRCRRRAARGTSACVTWHRLSALLPASSTGWMKLLFKKGEKL